MKKITLAMALLALGAFPALAQTAPSVGQTANDLLPNIDLSTSSKMIQYVILITALSLAPSLVVMTTSFTRIIVALSFLRSGLGMQTTPANIVIVSLALILTGYVMAPTIDQAWTNGIKPFSDGQITQVEAIQKTAEPFRVFMQHNVREKELALFQGLANQAEFGPQASVDDFRILVPAFMVSELRRGFEIGFLIILPFLIIDIAVATITMSMGMMMLPPTVLSLPFKVMFFVLIDGWSLLVGNLVRSFH
jgi:flagellar biosynthetic protein FliP